MADQEAPETPGRAIAVALAEYLDTRDAIARGSAYWYAERPARDALAVAIDAAMRREGDP